MLRRTERRLLRAVSPLVLLASTLMAYYAHGPFGTSPVVVHTSLVAVSDADGVYMRGLPDFVFIRPGATDVTMAHETLHYEHPTWTECQVSDTLAAQGMDDYYSRMGLC